MSVKELALQFSQNCYRTIEWREGAKKRCIRVSQPFAFEPRTAIWTAMKNGF